MEGTMPESVSVKKKYIKSIILSYPNQQKLGSNSNYKHGLMTH